MIKKLWTVKHLEQIHSYIENYNIPKVVFEEIKTILEILDNNYGNNRDESDDGGCVLLILGKSTDENSTEYERILTEYRLNTELMEFKDILFEENNLKWYSELYIMTEYGVSIIYCKNTGR